MEAENLYTNLFDYEFEKCSPIIDNYLSTLSVAYVAEARCYLELGEYSTAIRRFQEGMNVLCSRIQQYVELTLTSNPAIYLQPELKGIVDLRRLTEVYSWMDPTLSESDVFEMHREVHKLYS